MAHEIRDPARAHGVLEADFQIDRNEASKTIAKAAQGIVAGTIDKTADATRPVEVRVTVRPPHRKRRIDLREFRSNGLRQMASTAKGFTLEVSSVDALIDALREAQRLARLGGAT